MTTSIVTETPTFLQWTPDAAGTLHLVRELAVLCPACEEPCGVLIEGVCLGCRLDWDNHTISEYEATEADAYWDAAERCSSCGID